MKKFLVVLLFLGCFILLSNPVTSWCEDEIIERSIQGNQGVDIFFMIATNTNLLKMDYVYLSGMLYRNNLRSLGWPLVYSTNDFDVFQYSNEATIICYYKANSHCAIALFLGDIVN